MIASIRRAAGIGFAVGTLAASLVYAGPLKDGPVKRGTRLEELKVKFGEAQKVEATTGEGVRVEKWYYADGVVVVVQDGFVIDSFVDQGAKKE